VHLSFERGLFQSQADKGTNLRMKPEVFRAMTRKQIQVPGFVDQVYEAWTREDGQLWQGNETDQ
jgi:hypothetical protein